MTARKDLARRHGLDLGAELYRITSAAGYAQDVEAASLADAVESARDRWPSDITVTITDGTAVIFRRGHLLATITAI